jgi:hypothetical protein
MELEYKYLCQHMNTSITTNTQELSPAEKRKAYNKAYREANKEKNKEYQKKYQQAYRKNKKEELKIKSKAYREANKEEEKMRSKSYYEQNKDRIKSRVTQYHKHNREQILIKKKNKYKSNKESHKTSCKKWADNNKELIAANKKNYRESNKEKIKEYAKHYYQHNKEKIKRNVWLNHKRRLLTDKLYATKHKLRILIYNSFKRIAQNKPTDTLSLLGCTWEEAKAHFESLFREGMSWENHGEWHIDHIRPVSSFGMDELHLMNHISNLQPLWAKDNLSKRDNYILLNMVD